MPCRRPFLKPTLPFALLIIATILAAACADSETLPYAAANAVAAGGKHTCLLQNDGPETGSNIVCWGANGEADKGQADPPAGRFTSVSAGYEHTCGITDTGTASCWGDDSSGQSAAPTGQLIAIDAGRAHTCALQSDGTAQCWGSNKSGQLDAPAGTSFTAITTGGQHSCGLRQDGRVECWGENTAGESTPPDSRFYAVSAGSSTTCGIKLDSTIICWGWAFPLQWRVFTHELLPYDEWPLHVNGFFTSIGVSDGGQHTCGLRTDGAIRCWGDRRVNLPDDNYVSIGVGYGHSCGLYRDGTVVCRGSDEYGQAAPP